MFYSNSRPVMFYIFVFKLHVTCYVILTKGNKTKSVLQPYKAATKHKPNHNGRRDNRDKIEN